MTNISLNETVEVNTTPPFRYFIYVLVGFSVSIANYLIFITVLLAKELRSQKQYVVVGGLAFFDAVNATACFMAGEETVVASSSS